jgi:hypothetical protein
MSKAETAECQICRQTKSTRNGTIGEVIRPSLSDFIKKKAPQWDGKGFICLDDLGKFRRDYVKEVLEDEIGELSALDNEVIESLQQHEILSSDISKQFEKKLTFGERLSDTIAAFGGIGPSSSSSAWSCSSGSPSTVSSSRPEHLSPTRTS